MNLGGRDTNIGSIAVTLRGEMDFAGGIKIKILRLGDYSGLLMGPV